MCSMVGQRQGGVGCFLEKAAAKDGRRDMEQSCGRIGEEEDNWVLRLSRKLLRAVLTGWKEGEHAVSVCRLC